MVFASKREDGGVLRLAACPTVLNGTSVVLVSHIRSAAAGTRNCSCSLIL